MSLALVLNAAEFAARRHRNQRRKGEDEFPYINHPLQVAHLIGEVGGIDDPEIIIAALLHDTIEDTNTSAEEIAERFGDSVCNLVLEVSDDTELVSSERKRLQIERASSLSRGAALIKLADKTSNISDIIASPPRGWSLRRRCDYLDWAEAVVNACPPVNAALEALFRNTLNDARSALSEVNE